MRLALLAENGFVGKNRFLRICRRTHFRELCLQSPFAFHLVPPVQPRRLKEKPCLSAYIFKTARLCDILSPFHRISPIADDRSVRDRIKE